MLNSSRLASIGARGTQRLASIGARGTQRLASIGARQGSGQTIRKNSRLVPYFDKRQRMILILKVHKIINRLKKMDKITRIEYILEKIL
ncbi:hypothetical protein [Leptospira borgpetersenii]|uniref:hypothetical protein n=1 Tax=Leptospira borgpetersenii TaxID=174 RepID=UPI0002EAB430|nr:hypothetical protein [Leptospira borgpetersenii]